MRYRSLGASGLKVPELSFGAATFGGTGPLFSAWGRSGVEEATRLVDLCLEAGANLFDTADVYSDGQSEEILGAAIKGRRSKVLLSTKIGLPVGNGPGEAGASRHRLLDGVDAALRRLGTDYIDLLQLHAFDAFTPVEETLYTLDQLVKAGTVRYVGVSNFSGWQLMKSLALARQHGWPPYVAHQVYYSLIGRDYEWELMPLGLDQGVGALIWSPQRGAAARESRRRGGVAEPGADQTPRRGKRRDAGLSLLSVLHSRWIHAAQSSPGVSESTEMHADPDPLASTFGPRLDERSASQAAEMAARAALQGA